PPEIQVVPIYHRLDPWKFRRIWLYYWTGIKNLNRAQLINVKKVFTFFLIFKVSYCLHAQTVYLDSDNRKITEQEFNGYNRANLLSVKNDALYCAKTVLDDHT